MTPSSPLDDDFDPTEVRGPRSWWRRWDLLAGPVLFLVAIYFAFQWTMAAIVHHRPVRSVPDLKGKSVLESLELLSQANLALKKDGEQFDSSTPAGTVLEQNPAAGSKVREGKIVRVTVSQGGEKVLVPSLAGLELREAEIQLRQKNLALGELSEIYSLRFAQNRVVSQDPEPNGVAEKNSLVSLTVSKGSPPEGTLLVPDFTSKPLEEAQKWAKSHKVEISSVVQESSLQGSPGTVLRQDPRADSVLNKSASLKLVVVSNP